MKVILYMASTLNGYIAKEDGDTPWSNAEWKSFSRFVKKSKNIVVGKKTYDIMKSDNELIKIGNPFVVVLTKQTFPHDSNTILADSPKKALKILSDKKFPFALIAGGGMTNSSFMKEKLVDEIYLDVEPIVFGKGINLFSENNFEMKLNLIESKNLSKNTLQLHYKILKIRRKRLSLNHS